MDERARAIEELYRRRYRAFRSGLAPFVGDVDAARDVVQEAFARALRARRRYRGEGSLEAWIWKIAVRVAFESRRNGREVADLDRAAATMEVPDLHRDPALAAALRGLPPRRRLIVFLRYFADLSYDQIADLCGISPGTVAASLARAREDLLTTLSREGVAR